MSIEARNLETTPPYDRLTLLLMGREGSGKSWLAATGRKNVLFLDYDQRAEALAGRKGIFSITLRDPPYPKYPEAFADTLDILSQLERSRDISTWEISGKKFFDVPAGTIIRTVVPDSITVLAKCIMNAGLSGSPGIRREISFGSGTTQIKVQVPKSFDGWGAEMAAVEDVMLRLLAIKDIDLICTIHESNEEAADSTQEAPKFTGKVCPFPVRHGRLIKYFNECWRLKRESGPVPTIQFDPDFYFTTKCGLNLGKATVKPDIEYLLAEHIKNTKPNTH